MFKNSVIQMTTGKLIGATLLPNSILLISGLVAWRLWSNKQTQLQTKTNELNSEIQQIKEQIAEIQTEKNRSPSKPPPLSNKLEDPMQAGLFEFLINDNIQLRKHDQGN